VAGDGDDLLGVERVEPDVDGCGHGAMTPPRRGTHHPCPRRPLHPESSSRLMMRFCSHGSIDVSILESMATTIRVPCDA
jgi:hypothetical protein